jgi:hypothetical protein
VRHREAMPTSAVVDKRCAQQLCQQAGRPRRRMVEEEPTAAEPPIAALVGEPWQGQQKEQVIDWLSIGHQNEEAVPRHGAVPLAAVPPVELCNRQQSQEDVDVLNRPAERARCRGDRSEALGDAAPRCADECVVCMQRPQEIAFIPCGHLSVCHICAPSMTTCPVCRGGIENTLRVYAA